MPGRARYRERLARGRGDIATPARLDKGRPPPDNLLDRLTRTTEKIRRARRVFDRRRRGRWRRRILPDSPRSSRTRESAWLRITSRRPLARFDVEGRDTGQFCGLRDPQHLTRLIQRSTPGELAERLSASVGGSSNQRTFPGTHPNRQARITDDFHPSSSYSSDR